MKSLKKPFRGYDKEEIMATRGENLTEKQKKALGKRNQEIARLKEEENLSWGEIGRRFGLSRSHVKEIGHKFSKFKTYNKTKHAKPFSMSAFIYTPCVLCGKEDPSITVYAQNTGYPIGKKCWKQAEKLHQLNLISIDEKLKENG